MNIYKAVRRDYEDYDEYGTMVVIAKDEEEARLIVGTQVVTCTLNDGILPIETLKERGKGRLNHYWDNYTFELIGHALEGTAPTLVCALQHHG